MHSDILGVVSYLFRRVVSPAGLDNSIWFKTVDGKVTWQLLLKEFQGFQICFK